MSGGQFIAPDISAKTGSASQAETFIIGKLEGSGGGACPENEKGRRLTGALPGWVVTS
jgi:hypothetical protein